MRCCRPPKSMSAVVSAAQTSTGTNNLSFLLGFRHQFGHLLLSVVDAGAEQKLCNFSVALSVIPLCGRLCLLGSSG